MSNPPESKTHERRIAKRRAVELPVRFRSAAGGEAEISAQTRDLSSSGVFLYTERTIEPGSKIELVVMLPPELGLGQGGWTMCQASVVRVEKSDGNGVGVAATFDRIEMLPELM